MATLGDGTDPPEQNREGKDNHSSGARELLISLSELRATVSQLLKEAGQPKEVSSSSNFAQPGKCRYRLFMDCVTEMTGLSLWGAHITAKV